jgi:ipoprotein LpqH
VKCGLLIAVGVATIVAGVAGCSGGNKASGPSSSSATSSSAATSSGAASPVVCSTTDGKFSIAIGEVITGVIVGLEPDGSVVHNVGLGTVNGVVMSFTEGAPGNNASTTKNGNAYRITGTATGVDNGGQQVSKPFTIDANCP